MLSRCRFCCATAGFFHLCDNNKQSSNSIITCISRFSQIGWSLLLAYACGRGNFCAWKPFIAVNTRKTGSRREHMIITRHRPRTANERRRADRRARGGSLKLFLLLFASSSDFFREYLTDEKIQIFRVSTVSVWVFTKNQHKNIIFRKNYFWLRKRSRLNKNAYLWASNDNEADVEGEQSLQHSRLRLFSRVFVWPCFLCKF